MSLLERIQETVSWASRCPAAERAGEIAAWDGPHEISNTKA